jgi:HEAT repeat protein
MARLPTSSSPLPELLGTLVQLLRTSPKSDDRIRKALDLLAAKVARDPGLIEAGIENNWALDGDPLKERLQIRHVDAIRIAAGAARNDLLALAKALAADAGPVPSSAAVQVRLFPESVPIQTSGERFAIADPNAAMVPRARPGDQLAQLVESVLKELHKAIRDEDWRMVLHDAQAVMRMLPGLSEEIRRINFIALRRLLTRHVQEALIEQVYRVPEEQARTAEVMRVGGLHAAELMLEILSKSDTVGPRAFLVDSLAGMPEAFQLIAPLARSKRPAEARLGAELLGRLGVPEAVPLLTALMQHADEKTRLAAIDGLARYRDKAAVEPLRKALGHQSAAIRGRAGRALASRGSGAIAMPLLVALEAERDQGAWEELLEAIAGIDAPEAAAALSRIALKPKGLFDLGGNLIRRQLLVVRTLAASNTSAAKQALARIAAEGEGEVKEAAGAALNSE